MSTPERAASDRNLLFGILALQMDFIGRDALIRGMNAWVLEKTKPLGQVLVEQGAMAEDARALLEPLVRKHLQMHGDDPAKSLASVGSVESARRELEQIADADVQASLAHVLTRREAPADPWATREPSVGTPTSSGLRFRVLRPHAKGGLGQVSVALDEELRREVALKEIQDRHADHPDSRARFLLEAEVTGGLEHPGIVPVYGLGSYPDGRPFYAMRFIKGDSLQEAIALFHKAEDAGRLSGERGLALRKLLGRFIDVCNAIAYAHSRGVLHRDLKPGNVMLGPYGETLVVDWGLAKALGARTASENEAAAERPLQPVLSDSAMPTQAGTAIGTPAYMPPEQAAGRLDELGPASDVYSLGATLYCLLTGRAPFGGDVEEVLRRVQRGDFPRPRDVARSVPAALEAVCLKAMALKPQDRYPTPRALAADVERWLADEPVTAWREPWRVRARRWARRHRALVTSAAAAMLALLISAVPAFVLIMASRDEAIQSEQKTLKLATEKGELAEEKGRLAEEKSQLAVANEELADKRKEALEEESRQRTKAEWLLYASQIALAQREWQDGNIPHARELLAACRWDFRGWEHAYLHRLVNETQQSFAADSNSIFSVCFSPDGKRLASAGVNGMVFVWDSVSRQKVLALKDPFGSVRSVCFSPDGKRIVSSSQDRNSYATGGVTVWDAVTGQEVHALRKHTSAVRSVCFSPDGKQLAGALGDKTVRVWDTVRGREVLVLKEDIFGVGSFRSVCFSPDGKRLAGGSSDGKVRVWDAVSGQKVLALKWHTNSVEAVCFSPDGRHLASASGDGTVRVWDTVAEAQTLVFTRHTGFVSSVCFSPDGKRLASGAYDRTVRVWDVLDGQEILSLKEHIGPVSFSPDGNRLASVTGDGKVRVWDLLAPRVFSLKDSNNTQSDVCFSPEGKRFASAVRDKTVRVWDAVTGREVLALKGHTSDVISMCFSLDGMRLASGAGEGTVRVWDAVTGQGVFVLKGHIGRISRVCFSPDGKRLASASHDGTIRVWDAIAGREVLVLKGRFTVANGVCFSPDGKRLAGGVGDGTVRLWDAVSGQEILVLKGHIAGVSSVCFSPDGKRLASAAYDKTVRVWDAITAQEVLALKGHNAIVNNVCFSPDGKRLASCAADGTVRLWGAVSGQQVLVLKLPFTDFGNLSSVCFSPDGKRLAGVGVGDPVHVWEGAITHDVLALRGDPGGVFSVAFSDDSKRVVANSYNSIAGTPPKVRAWDVATGIEIIPCVDPPPPGGQHRVSSPDGRMVATIIPSPFGGGNTVEVRRESPFTMAPTRRRQEEEARALYWHQQQATEAEQRQQWFASVFHIDQLLRIGPEKADLLVRRGRARMELGLLDLAREDLARVLHLEPKEPAVLRETIVWLQRLRKMRPAAVPSPEDYLLAVAHHHLGQEDEARRWLAREEGWAERGQLSLRASFSVAAGAAGSLAALLASHGAIVHYPLTLRLVPDLVPKEVPAQKNPPNLERRAAAEVVRIQGRVTIELDETNKRVQVGSIEDLPAMPFHVLGIDLLANPKISHEDFRVLQGLPSLQFLDLEGTAISDADLAHLRDLRSLQKLQLGYTRVTGEGLSHLASLPNLASLNLTAAPLTDAAVARLKELPKLRSASLSCTSVGDQGLRHLKDVAPLEELWLEGMTNVSDRGLGSLTAHAATLHTLGLSDTPLTDEAVQTLAQFKKLKKLRLSGTAMTRDGVSRLRTALPSCELIAERLTPRPANGPNVKTEVMPFDAGEHAAAKLALKQGAVLRVVLDGGGEVEVKKPEDMPARAFRTRQVWFEDRQKLIDDSVLDRLSGLAGSVDSLDLVFCSQVTDAGLVHLRKWSKLKCLKLNGTSISDDGLVSLAALPNLTVLYFDGTAIGDTGLAHLRKLKLEELVLATTRVTDDGLKHLVGMQTLIMLDLNNAKITDAGLNHLRGLTALRTLKLANTKVTDEGIRRLKTALPDCRIER